MLVAACLTLASAVPSHAADLPAALHARFGQTSEAVAKALGDKAQRLDPPLDYGVAQAKILAKGMPVGGVAMTALYQFDQDDRLAQVLLERRDAGAQRKSFEAVLNALEKDLGKPIEACEKLTGVPHLVERRWRTAGTAANLTFMDFTGQAMTLDPNRDATNPLVPSYVYEPMKPRSFPRRIVLRLFPASNKQLVGQPACYQPPLRR
jgi:hypothetical protein